MEDVALVLAAGLGTRMRSSLAKVLHPLLGQPMVCFPVEAAKQAGFSVVVVVNHQEDAVRAALAHAGVGFARQPVPRGTGDAVAVALDALPAQGTLAVLAGDAPLIRPQTLARLRAAHGDNLVTVLTARVPEPAAYGRIRRDAAGRPAAIVEAAEASPEELALDEINTGVYLFDLGWLRAVLPGLKPHPPKHELYLTDTLALAAAEGRAGALLHDDADEVMGVNDRLALAQARRALQDRVLRQHALDGVTFEDMSHVVVEQGVRLAEDVTVGLGAVLRRGTQLGRGVVVGPHCVLEDVVAEEGAELLAGTVATGARIGPGARVGPLARLRPGAEIGPGAHVGNFVEIKNSKLGLSAKVNHLAYVGDATVGAGANVGAGVITCNYDGFHKHRTTIGARAFIGSNAALVAPVTVGDDALVGAGSVVVRDVPADSVAIARGQQVNREGAAPLLRERMRKRSAR